MTRRAGYCVHVFTFGVDGAPVAGAQGQSATLLLDGGYRLRKPIRSLNLWTVSFSPTHWAKAHRVGSLCPVSWQGKGSAA